MESLPNDRELNSETLHLEVTHIDKDETIFSNSIFSMKPGDKMSTESLMEELMKGRQSDACLDSNILQQLEEKEYSTSETKKRRTRAERSKKTTGLLTEKIR
mgnify:CR=1 FL=1